MVGLARRTVGLAVSAGLLLGTASVRAVLSQPSYQSQSPAPEGESVRVRALLKQATDLYRAGKADEVVAMLEPLLGPSLEREPELAGDVHYWMASAYFRLTKYPEALEHYQRAIDDQRTAHNPEAEARSFRMLGQAHKTQGTYAAGLEACEEALALDRSAGNARGAALDSVVRGAIRDLMGDHRAALDSYEQALPVLGSENSSDAANLFNEIAITHKNLGNYADALKYYDRALARDVEIKDTRGQMFVLLNLGVLYGTLGELERGIGFSQRGLELARQIGERRGERILLLNLGEQYWAAGNRERAVESLEQALTTSRREGARSEENLALKDLADIHVATGNLALARQQYDEALRIERAIGERRTESATLVALSDLSLREGRSAEASRLAKEALALGAERPEFEWNARRALARAEAAEGQSALAIDELQTAARIINDLRAHVVSDSSKIAFVDERQVVFQDLAVLLMAAGREGEALEAAEAGRARAFADLLEQRQVRGKPAEREALAAVRRAQDELAAASDALPRAAMPGGSPLPGTRGTAALDASLATLGSDHRELASLVTAESPTLPDILESARRLDASFVEYLVTDRHLLTWVVTPAGAVHAVRVDVGRDRIETLVRDVRTAIDAAAVSAFHRSAALASALRELEGLLIAPIGAWLPASPAASLIVIPHGSLALVPFAALENSAGRPLAERYTLSFAPAASIYRHTRDKRQAGSGRTRRALIVADPTAPDGTGVERLPWAQEEGRRVAARLQAMPVRLLSGAAASEFTVKSEAGGYSLLHFATHGLIAPDRPLASSLLLAAGGGEDGYLRVDEVFNLELNADLVALSGCSTGLGRLTGDGIIGLTRAFIYAGTPSVVVSQWDVSDRATTFLMDHFYAALQRGTPKAAALRAASLQTRRLYPHPALWAPFVLVGEPR